MTIKDLKNILNKFDENQPIKLKKMIQNSRYGGCYNEIYGIEDVIEEQGCVCFRLSEPMSGFTNTYKLSEFLEGL